MCIYVKVIILLPIVKFNYETYVKGECYDFYNLIIIQIRFLSGKQFGSFSIILTFYNLGTYFFMFLQDYKFVLKITFVLSDKRINCE